MAKVLLHTLVFAPDGVSTAYLMTDLVQQLQRLGHSVTVLTTTPHYNPDQTMQRRQPLQKRWLGLLYMSHYDGISVWHVKMPMKGKRVLSRILDYLFFHAVSLLIGTFFIGSHDIVIAPSPPLSIGVIGWAIAVRRGAPFVYNVQEIFPDFLINQRLITNPIVVRAMRLLERFVYSRSTMVVSISEWFNKIIMLRNVPANRLCVIPNFVDTELYKPLPRKNSFSDKYDFMKNFVVLYGGNIGLSQDWESILFAAKAVLNLPITFVIVGDGVLREWLEKEIEKRGLHNVKLLGYQTRELMPYVNASSDICTIPMKVMTTSDTFPSKIYTIMACAKPVIASADADSEIYWLINQVRCGRLVLPEDPEAYANEIVKAFRDRSILAEEGERGRRFVIQEHTKEAAAQKYDYLIRQLTEKK